MSNLNRIAKAVRPGEWVALGFLAYVLLRIALADGGLGALAGKRTIKFPSADIGLAVLGFALIKLARPVFRKLPPGRARLVSAMSALLFVATLFSLQSGSGDINLPWLYPARPALLALDLLAIVFLARGRVARFLAEIREWLPCATLLCFYPLIPLLMSLTGVSTRDAELLAVDRRLFFGHNLALECERFISAPLSEWMALCYSAYLFIILLGFGALYLREDIRAFREVAFSVALVLACGYIGYTLVPAAGPLFTQGFRADLSLFYMGPIKEALMDHLRIPLDCFPSLHTGITLVIAAGLYRHARSLFFLLLPLILSMPLACVYLRYHYGVDVIAGMLLAAGAAAWASKLRAA